MSSSEGMYDCSQLLEQAANAEAIFSVNESESAAMDFGHPDPPRLHVFNLSEAATVSLFGVFMVAYTQHCVWVQILLPGSDDRTRTQPLEIPTESLDAEEISCVTVVSLEDRTLLTRPSGLTTEQGTEEGAEQSPNSILLRGAMPSGREQEPRLSIAIGTSSSRLYAVELVLDHTLWALRQVSLSSGVASLFEVLPCDDNHTAGLILRRSSKQPEQEDMVPFQPQGGVTALSPLRLCDGQKESTHVWIAYRDGTLVRLHHAGFFPSVWKIGAEDGRSLDDLLGCKTLVRCRLNLPRNNMFDLQVVPLPKYHPSPMAPLPPWKPVVDMDAEEEFFSPGLMSADDRDEEDTVPEFHEALVFGSGPGASLLPTLCFYTSEDHFIGRTKEEYLETGSMSTSEGAVLGAVVGGTKAVVGGIVGSAIGALRWGFGAAATPKPEEVTDSESGVANEEMIAEEQLATAPFPSLWQAPAELFAGQQIHDAPREIESCSIDPDGILAAISDNLGRVMLVDLATKQVVRLWKGYREATCVWIESQSPGHDPGSPGKKLRFLAIHTRQRRVVEVWRVRHGSKLSTIQVGRDAHLVPCSQGIHGAHQGSCYLVHSQVPGTSINHMERITINWQGMDTMTTSVARRRVAKIPAPPSSREAAVRLQHLQQLLSTTNVEYSSQDVLGALQEIKSLADLATALDLLGRSRVLEENLGVNGSDFQKLALAHCNAALDEAVKGSDGDALSNPNVTVLSFKLVYHSQIVKAYDVLHQFEVASKEALSQTASTPSHWSAEALGWATTYEQVMRINIDLDTPDAPNRNILFATFTSSCAVPDKKSSAKATQLQIYFSDSSRTRRELLAHIFRPLLADVFSFNVVNSLFEALGIRHDDKYILKCFGEWFMTLKAKEAWEKGLYAVNPPMARFLQDMVSRQLDKKGESNDKSVALGALFSFCEEATDLVRAFMLATLCREAMAKVSPKKERNSYGRILSIPLISSWDTLLRKLRVCLLVSLRLKGARLSAPISVRNIDSEDMFSVYEWLAIDELNMSHNHDEIVSLEKACEMSSYAFDPSSVDGDGPSRFKMLQQSCLAAAISEEERAEYLVDCDDDDRFGALLLYLSNHNEPTILVAHRALILASKWSRDPKNLDVLRDSLKALLSLDLGSDMLALATAVRLEVWKSLCPVYRAHLFGFGDVQEVSEDIIEPLLRDPEWLTGFGRIALDLLVLMKSVPWDDVVLSPFQPKLKRTGTSWPPVKTDVLLKRLVEKLRKIDNSSLETHCVVVSALLTSRDVETLVKCVPAIYECFMPQSLFNPMVNSGGDESERHRFVKMAVLSYAESYQGPAMDSFGLGEIETLSNMWGFDLKSTRTLFLVAMYDLGRDRIVDELLTKSSSLINIHQFVDDGVDIVCRRLNFFLSGSHVSVGLRETMSLLDAETCEWIKQRAGNSRSLVERSQVDIPVGNTHLFALRLLSLSAGAKADTGLRVRIHALGVLSGTLVKALSKKT